jgi:hypothetical protein
MKRTTTPKSTGPKLVPALMVVISLFAIGAVATRGMRGARRELEAPVAAVLPGATAAPRTKDARPKNKGRSLVGGLTFLAATITLSLLATTGSYALWNGKTVVNGSTLGTGSIGLTINDATDYTLGLPTAKLAPGHSVLATATFKNTGITPVKASVSSTTITANSNGLASSLTVIVTPVSSVANCTTGLTGGTTAALGSFNTTSAPYSMPAGSSQLVCFELKLDSAAPTSEEGGSTTFRMNVVANQVHP